MKGETIEKAWKLGKIEGKRRRKPQRMKEFDSITDSVEKTLMLKIEGRRRRG